jgi:hypothetical protein
VPQACKLCVHPDQAAVTAAFVSGATDREVGKRFGLSHVSAGRHRREHVLRPMQTAAAALDRGRGVRERREDLVQQAEAGDPSAFVALAGIVADLRKVHERLERTADAAEQDNQRLAVSALSAQQLRAAEVRAKIGGVGGFAPARTADQAAAGQVFSVNILFSTGETVSINTVQPAVAGNLIGADEGDGAEPDEA